MLGLTLVSWRKEIDYLSKITSKNLSKSAAITIRCLPLLAPTTRQPRAHNTSDRPHLSSIVIPFIYTKSGISVHFKPADTFRSMLVSPEDKVPGESVVAQ